MATFQQRETIGHGQFTGTAVEDDNDIADLTRD